MLVRFSTATHLLSERKRVEGKTLSNKTPGSSKSDRCSVLRESVSESGERSFQDCGEKNPHSQVVQEAAFAVVGIGIALLRSHARKAAFALNRSGDFAGAGREITLLPEHRFQPSAAVSSVSRLPRTGDLCLLLFSDARAVSCPHVGEERFALRLGYMQIAHDYL